MGTSTDQRCAMLYANWHCTGCRLTLPGCDAVTNRRSERACDLGRPVGQDDLRPGPPDAGERLPDGPVALDPAVRRGRLHHGVLTRHLVSRHWDVAHLGD